MLAPLDVDPVDRYFEPYRYLCRRAARRFKSSRIDREDLEQVGAIGLLKACRRYDCEVEGGAPFAAYAWPFVFGEIRHYVRDHQFVVRPPRSITGERRREVGAVASLDALLHMPVRATPVDDLLMLDAAVSALPPIAQVVVRELYGGTPVREIGSQLGIAHQRVCEVKNDALARMRAVIGAARPQ